MAVKKKILVVDDEEKIVAVLKAYLEAEGYAVFTAYSGQQALEIFRQTSPSLVMLDLMLPDIPGEEVCRVIRRTSRTPIIMLTAKAQEENLLEGLNIGADDYVVKPASPREIVARAAAVLRRTAGDSLAAEVVTYDNDYLMIDYKSYIVRAGGAAADLTPTEFKLLACMAKSPGKAFTRDELITYALDGVFDGYDRTLDTYIKNLRRKIEPDLRKPRFILTVHGVGYRFNGEA